MRGAPSYSHESPATARSSAFAARARPRSGGNESLLLVGGARAVVRVRAVARRSIPGSGCAPSGGPICGRAAASREAYAVNCHSTRPNPRGAAITSHRGRGRPRCMRSRTPRRRGVGRPIATRQRVRPGTGRPRPGQPLLRVGRGLRCPRRPRRRQLRRQRLRKLPRRYCSMSPRSTSARIGAKVITASSWVTRGSSSVTGTMPRSSAQRSSTPAVR